MSAAVALFLRPRAEASGSCEPDAETLCIDDDPGDRRFAVRATFDTVLGGGHSGTAKATPLSPLGITEGGILSFFNPVNPEMLVKVKNGCSVNGHFWVFAAATTTAGFELTVTDTERDRTWTSTNPDETKAVPVANTAAFTCL